MIPTFFADAPTLCHALALRLIEYSVSRCRRLKAELDVLVADEVPRVEVAPIPQCGRGEQADRPACPVDVARHIELRAIVLHRRLVVCVA